MAHRYEVAAHQPHIYRVIVGYDQTADSYFIYVDRRLVRVAPAGFAAVELDGEWIELNGHIVFVRGLEPADRLTDLDAVAALVAPFAALDEAHRASLRAARELNLQVKRRGLQLVKYS